MKKFISMVMAAAMVVTMVPATAFAASGTTTAKVVDAYEATTDMVKADKAIAGPQLQLKVTDLDAKINGDDDFEIELTFNNKVDVAGVAGVKVFRGTDVTAEVAGITADVAVKAGDKDVVTITLSESQGADLAEGDMIAIDLAGNFLKDKLGTKATVKVAGDLGKADEMVFAEIVEKGIAVELDEDVADVAVDEFVTIDDIVIEPVGGKTFADVLDAEDEIVLTVSKGFEISAEGAVYYKGGDGEAWNEAEKAGNTYPVSLTDDDEITLTVGDWELAATELTIKGIEVQATTAKEGDVATLKVKATGLDSKSVEVAQVVDMKVVMELTDEEDDVPVMYSGVNQYNDGITDESDHKALSVTIKETFAGAWSNHKAFTLTLPEGVYVTAVEAEDVAETEWAGEGEDINADFEAAYVKGDHVFFDFAKRSFEETHIDGVAAEISFVLTLVADPGFVGDVTLTLEGAAVDTQEVVIAKFETPMFVEATQNDVIIDYRFTEVPTAVVVKEAVAGLWDTDLTVTFAMEEIAKDDIVFEDVADVTVNEESGMEIEEAGKNDMGFTVTERSDEEAAVVTIDGIELYMQRNVPAGPYSLDMAYGTGVQGEHYNDVVLLGQVDCTCSDCEKHNITDICDYETTVHEAWINVITAGRDKDDASFTKKVIVPIGENYMIAGEETIALDVPAYINANGYTMLPVRAVATALGINNNNVLWSQAAKQVTILYGQRIITMTVGEAVVYVNGSAIPAVAAVEVVDGRAFLGLRDLANALGVTEIDYVDGKAILN